MLKLQESGRLDAKQHYVIRAKALDGIGPIGHACMCSAVLRHSGGGCLSTALHHTGMTNGPNTIQCLAQMTYNVSWHQRITTKLAHT